MMLAVAASARRRPSSETAMASFSAWKYLPTALTDSSDYSSAAFDDSSWMVGAAPFGNHDYTAGVVPDNAHAYDSRFADFIATRVELNSRVWIRRTLSLTSVPAGGFILVGYFDNKFTLWINGAQVASNATIANTGVTIPLSADNFMVGTNFIAARCDDESYTGPHPTNQSYFDFLLDPVY